MQICEFCFGRFSDGDLCPHCGHVVGEPQKVEYALPAGVLLKNRYAIGAVVGVGGFGITYKAWDVKLDMLVCIKEFYPSSLVNRSPGESEVVLYALNRKKSYIHSREGFLEEARRMAKFSSDSRIVNVYEYFEENGTCYIVMEFMVGCDLGEYNKKHPMSISECVDVIAHAAEALSVLHKEGIIHRDISPDNIFMCDNGNIKLLDFGAARFSQDPEAKLTIVLKHGYAPPEQYEKINRQGPWTDIYALGATAYVLLTGRMPITSLERKHNDTLPSPHQLNPEIDVNISNAIMKAMAPEIQFRFQRAEDFAAGLRNEKQIKDVNKEKKEKLRFRNISIIAVLALIICIGGVFLSGLLRQKDANTLEACELSLYYRLPEDAEDAELKEKAMKELAEDFESIYPGVIINPVGVKDSDYEKTILGADDGQVQLFESIPGRVSGVNITLSQETKDKLLVDIPETDCIYTGFYTLMIYANTGLVEDAPDSVTDITKLINSSETIAVSPEDKAIYEEIFGVVNEAPEEAFYNKEAAYLLSDTRSYKEVYSKLPARYKLIMVECDEINAWAGYGFSMLASGSKQDKASERFLNYLLSDKAQDILHMNGQSGHFPVNRKMCLEYLDIYKDYRMIGECIYTLKVEVGK